MANEEVRNRIQNAIGVHDDLLTIVKPHLKILWHGKDNSAGDSERTKKERETEEEMGRYNQRMDRHEVWRFPEGSGRNGRVERYRCNVICGSPMTTEVKGLRDERDLYTVFILKYRYLYLKYTQEKWKRNCNSQDKFS